MTNYQGIEASGLLSKCMELRFDAIMHSKLGNENSDADHIKCSRGPQVPHPCFKLSFRDGICSIACSKSVI